MGDAAMEELRRMRRAERGAWAQERTLERRMDAFERRHTADVKRLRAAGFLRDPRRRAG